MPYLSYWIFSSTELGFDVAINAVGSSFGNASGLGTGCAQIPRIWWSPVTSSPRIDLIAGDTPPWLFEDTENHEATVGDPIVVHLSSSEYVDLIVVHLSSSEYAVCVGE